MSDQENATPGVRRSRSALHPAADAEVTVDGRRVRVAILDVSLGGLRVLRPEGVHPAAGERVALRFPVDAGEPIAVTGTVVRGGEDQIAFQFDAGEQDEALRALIRRQGRLHDNCD